MKSWILTFEYVGHMERRQKKNNSKNIEHNEHNDILVLLS